MRVRWNRIRLGRIAPAAAAVLAAMPCLAQPVNDGCTGATGVGEGVVAFDTATATDDGAGCSGVRPQNEVWFAYTASADGMVTIRTMDVVGDTYLSAYDDCARTTILDCDDDCGGLESRMQFRVRGGSTYYVEVGNFSDTVFAQGNLEIVLAPSPDAPAVWSGEDFAFSKADNADWTLPENQDRISASVALTRANNLPLFNILQEAAWFGDCSPGGTRWAFGRAAD